MQLNRWCSASTRRIGTAVVVAWLGFGPTSTLAQETRPDLLTFARGAIPVRIEATPTLRVDMSHAVRIVDGNPGGFIVASLAGEGAEVGIVYELPASTTFKEFAIPGVLETPSPSQTFFRTVVVEGSAVGPEGPFELLARGVLDVHTSAGQSTHLVPDPTPVQWIRLRLSGGIEVLRDEMFLEFSELVGYGEQETPTLEARFGGSWRGRGVSMTLEQGGARVSGCYDRGSPLTGTVAGRLLKAIGIGATDGVVSQFILAVTGEGTLRGLRSTNGAPFRLMEATSSDRPVPCEESPPRSLGCGAVLHGITFAFDSAEILDASTTVLDGLASALAEQEGGVFSIEGHTSSEGDEAYNLELSQRRAEAVTAALVARGVSAAQLRAVGRGEAAPIATNDDEAGRSMNRRVEVRCTG